MASPFRCFGLGTPRNTASGSVTVATTGSHRFTINGYSRSKDMAPGRFLSSETFCVGGCDWVVRYFPSSFAPGSAGHIGITLALQSDASHVKPSFDFLLRHGHKTLAHFRSAPVLFERNGGDKGWPKFMEKRVLEASLKNDRFIIICTVSIMVVPPSDYHRNLGQLLESRMGADVTFDVRGRMFAAHRSVLAAQSMVFQKELYGPMRESGMPCIKIEDMESTVFETLLHFVYNDSLPELDKGSAIFIIQHLLEASDRYDLQRLKLICERELYEGINVGTVASNLVLADQHQCDDLKAACLDFMAFRGKLDAISKTDGYKHLIASGHPVLNELVMKLGKQVVGHAKKK